MLMSDDVPLGERSPQERARPISNEKRATLRPSTLTCSPTRTLTRNGVRGNVRSLRAVSETRKQLPE